MMFLYLYVIVWLLACISVVLCQDGIGTNDATKSSTLSEVSRYQDFETTTSQKLPLSDREEQIEDEFSNSATTTEKFMEKRMFMIKPVNENDEYQEIFTVKFNETGPTTIRSSISSTKIINKVTFAQNLNKYDESDDLTDDDVDDDIDFTTSFSGLTKVSPTDTGERKTRQRLDGLKGVTTNRGKTRFQNEPGTSEFPEILTTLRHKKPIRVRPTDQNLKDDISSTSIVNEFIDTTTTVSLVDNSEIEQQRPKFKKPPLIATHHPNFGTSTEASRRPAIRPNLNLKQKISSSSIKTKLPESNVTGPEGIIPNTQTAEVVSTNTQLNKIRPIKVINPKVTTSQQPIPPTAIAWALASLKAPNNTNKILRKPSNLTNIQEQMTKIKPFVTWSTRLQKINEDNSNTTFTTNNTQVAESNESSTEIPIKYESSESSTDNRFKPEITTTESLINKISTPLVTHSLDENNSSAIVVGGDTDHNKYEVYGSQKPEVENTTTVIETLRPSSSTTPSESQNSNLLLVTSYKSILENNNSSEDQQNYFSSSENPISNNTPKNEVTKNEFVATSDQSNIFQNSGEISNADIIEGVKRPAPQTSTEIFSKAPGIVFDYSEDHSSSTFPTTSGSQSSSSDVTFLFSHDIDLVNQNHSTTTEHYIESIKTKLDSKINKTTDNQDSSELIDFSHMFSSERPEFNSTDESDVISMVSEKTTSGKHFYFIFFTYF